MSQYASRDLETLLVYFRERLERVDVGLVISPELFDVRALPATAHDRHFCLDVPETRNLELYRHADHVRNRERLVVRFLHQITHGPEFNSQLAATRVEARITAALTRDPPPDVRVSYETTRRIRLGDFIVTEITFGVVHDEQFQPRLSVSATASA